MLDEVERSNRVYLTVPFIEIEDVKRLGAAWCPIRKRWWIGRHDIAANASIYKWIENQAVAARAKEAHDWLTGTPTKKRKRQATARQSALQFSAAVDTRSTSAILPACSCTTPPWEDCEHTTGLAPIYELLFAGQQATDDCDEPQSLA